METMLYKNDRVSVLESGSMLSRIFPEGGEEYQAYTVKTVDLKPLPTKRLSATEKALAQDPEVLKELAQHVVRIEVSSSPDAADQCALDISENSDISEFDAADYIRVVTDKSHGAKFDVIVSADIPSDLRVRVGLFFNESGHRAHNGELQIGSRSLALWLMNVYNLRPKKAN